MIYLDHAATTPLLPEALEAMLPWLGVPANPSSSHRAGQAAAAAVEHARARVAALAGADPSGVVFTSGATEANHLGLRGVARLRPGRLLVSPIEHPCVRGAADALAAEGRAVDTLPVGHDGVVRLPESLPSDADVVALMAANHETGVLQPIAHARALADEVGAWLHVDATHALGKVPLAAVADALACSSHKLGGPAGVGALVLRDGGAFPAMFPGVQERGRRAGTVNVAGVVGFGVAAALAAAALDRRAAHHAALGERLEAGLRGLGGRIVGGDAPRVPGTTMVVFAGVRGDTLVVALDLRGVCVSAGAACASGSLGPSPVLLAIGDPEPTGALRFSLGDTTTESEIDAVLALLPDVLEGARRAASFDDLG